VTTKFARRDLLVRAGKVVVGFGLPSPLAGALKCHSSCAAKLSGAQAEGYGDGRASGRSGVWLWRDDLAVYGFGTRRCADVLGIVGRRIAAIPA